MRFIYMLIFLVCNFVGRNSFAQQDDRLKNVLVILSDDHALKVTGAYGNDIIRTPSIDKLSGSGLTFQNAYCQAPICSASRQSLLTGKYPHATGVNLLFTPFQDEGNITVAEHLEKFDFNTALIGKSHFNNWVWYSLYENGLPSHGFDTLIQQGEYRQFLEKSNMTALSEGMKFYNPDKNKKSVAEWMNWRGLPQPVYDACSRGTFYAREAIEFMRNSGDEPFFVWLAFNEPHHPYYFPIEYTGKYVPVEMPLPEGSPEDDRWIPEKYRNLTEAEKKGIIAAYYTSTEYLDKNIGLVLSALHDLDLERNTLVIYISDNGYLLHEHKRFEKHTMWEEAVNQPMIISWPGMKHAGKRTDAIVEYVDVVPTLLDILDIDPLDEAQGKSFVNLLNNPDSDFREYAFSEYLEDNLAMVTTREWKYMFTTGSRDLGIGYKTGYGPSGIVHRLYNLKEDPRETHDLSKKPEYAERLQQMQKLMLRHFMETHPDADSCPEELTLDGKLVWFCEPRDVGADQSLEDVPVRVFENN